MRPIASLLCLALLSCTAAGSDPSPDPVQPVQPVQPSEQRSDGGRDLTPQVAPTDLAQLVSGGTDFGFALQRAALSADADAVASPLSISEALAMTWAGAQGDTAVQMASTLHFTLPADRFHLAFDALDLALSARGGLKIVNSLWGQQLYPWRQPFLDTLATYYGAGMSLVDFRTAPEDARSSVNAWVAQETRDRIQNLIPPNVVTKDTRLILVNAITFDGAWQSPFEPYDTRDEYFRRTDGTWALMKAMHRTGQVRGALTDELVVAELPYDDGLSMVVISPRLATLASFEASLSAVKLQLILGSLTTEASALTLPRFRIASASVDLSKSLAEMGMPLAFDRVSADFGPMAEKVFEENLHIDAVIHKAFIAVGEKGTEAAAATAVVMGGDAGCIGPITPPQVRHLAFDRPFLFLIRDTQTGAMLFLGHVVEPHE